MKNYKVIYYNSGGYKTSSILKTHLIIVKENNKLFLYENNTRVGDVTDIELLLLTYLGYQESITIVDVINLSSHDSC